MYYIPEKQLPKRILKIWKNVYIYIFPTVSHPRDKKIIFSVDEKKKNQKERKEFLNLETTVVAGFHLVK